MRPGDEVALEIDPGKTLLVSLQTIHKNEGGNTTKVQFELNGQSRMTNVARNGAAASPQREVAEVGNPLHIGAPMPVAIVTVVASPRQHVQAGTTLLSLEAMKMETHMVADRDGFIDRVLVKSGDRVQAKDLLAVWRQPGEESAPAFGKRGGRMRVSANVKRSQVFRASVLEGAVRDVPLTSAFAGCKDMEKKTR